MIAVIGSTGNTGSKISAQLLKSGERVRAIGRTERGLAKLATAGAEPVTGDIGDAEFLARAFRGTRAVYSLLPVDPTWENCHQSVDRMGEAVVEAIRAAGVRCVVALSSVGAHLPADTGFITGLYRQEQRLHRLPGVNVLVLRPGLFFEGFFNALDTIKQHGVLASHPGGVLPWFWFAVAVIAPPGPDHGRPGRAAVIRYSETGLAECSRRRGPERDGGVKHQVRSTCPTPPWRSAR